MPENMIKTVPFAWYDIYVRLFAGATAVFLGVFFIKGVPDFNSISELAWVGTAGYVVGHLLQPAFGIVWIKIEGVLGVSDVSGKLRDQINSEHNSTKVDRAVMLSSKQHAETCSMTAVFLILFIYGVISCVFVTPDSIALWPLATAEKIQAIDNRMNSLALFGGAVLFLFFAVERAYENKSRCQKVLNSIP
jgi:hypothetical protein